MEFKSWLLNELNLSAMVDVKFYDPDNIYNISEEFVTFIYTPDNKLFFNDGGTHSYLTNVTPDLFKRYSEMIAKITPEPVTKQTKKDRRIFMKYGYLVGRIGMLYVSIKSSNCLIISFWNDDKKDYENLDNCIKALYSRNLVRPQLGAKQLDVLISSPFGTFGIQNASNLTKGEKTVGDEEIQALHAKLHTMNPIAKKAAMEKLGVGGGGYKHPWQTASEKSGIINPGQKWWTSTSEST